MLTQLLHVQVAPARNPLLRDLHRQSTHQSEARLAVGEDPHHPSAPLYLLALRRSRPFVVRMRLLWLSGKTRHVRHSSMCSSTCSATFSLPLPRHLLATLEAIWRACSLAGAAKMAPLSRSSANRWRSCRNRFAFC